MRHFCFSLIALLGLATIPLRGQSNDPADHFLHAYTAVKKGEKAETSRDFRGAHAAYKQAVATLDQITARWPSWNPHIIKHRREKAGEGLTRVKPLMGKPGEQATEEEVAGPLPGGDNLTLLPDESPNRELPPPSTERRSSNGDPIAEIQNRLRQLQDDLRTTREKLERETAEKVELARKYDQAIKATEESARKQVIAEGRAQRAEDALVKAETDGVKSSEQLKTLRAEADAARKAVREIQIDREAGDELRQQFADRLANANKRMEALAQERDAARKDAADVPKRIAEMQKQLDSAVKEKGAISTKLAKVEGQLKLVTQERDDALVQIGKMREAQKQVDKLLAENTTLMARLDDAQKTITRLNSESVKREDEIALLKRDVTTVKRQLADAKKESTTYQQEMGELQTQLEAQAKDLALVKTNANTTAAERKKLQQENDILRGIVIRQQKEQAIRDGKRKLVLTELGKLELNSKALVTQIEYLTSPVVKLTPRERKLFKQPIIEITDAEVAIAAPKEDAESEVEEAAPSETASTASTAANPSAPTDAPIAEQTPVEKGEPVPAIAEKKEMAEVKAPTGTEPAPVATPPAEAAKVTAEATVSDVPPAPPASVAEVSGSNEALSLTAEGTAAPFELASAKTSGLLPSIPATKTAPEGDLPVKDKEEKTEGESAGAAPEVATTTTPNVPAELLPLARQGKEHFERSNYREAEKIYEKILAKAPNNLHALSNLGVVRFRSGKLKLAEEAFKKAIAVAPSDAFSHCTLGIVYYSQGKYDEAVNELTKAVAINPKNATAHNYLGITASQKGWQEAAQTELEAATALDPNYADAFFNLAVVFATQQPPNKESARKHYKRATELGAEPDSALEQLIK